jgi:pimeloyl-ACP methyl ester carboxylesterase
MNKWVILFAVGTSCLLPLPAVAQGKAAPVITSSGYGWQFSDVAGNRIAWSCTGQGQPTIILIAGLGLTARDSFGRIYQNYHGPGRLCMYDRAGMGDSKFNNPKTRTLDQLVGELHELSHANDWGSAVLVPHSFGGFLARAYAQKYPAEVRGILFLDVAQEDYVPRLKAEMSSKDWAIMDSLLAWNIRTFHEDYVQAQEAVRTAKLKSDLPITVLSRGVPYTSVRAAGVSDEGMDLYEYEHRALQAKIAALSKNSQHRVARYSSHVFNDSDPGLVIDEIKQLVARLPKP